MKRRIVTVLVHYDTISLYYSLFPLLASRHSGCFLLTDDIDYCLSKDTNQRLVIIRYFQGHGDSDRIEPELMSRLRDKYQRIVFFDDGASTGKTRFEVLPYVDRYYKRQLLKNRADYCREYYGSLIFSDYYHREFGIADEKTVQRVPANASDLNKIKLGWNLGIGLYPKSAYVQKVGVLLSRRGASAQAVFQAVRTLTRLTHRGVIDYSKTNIVHSRFSLIGPPTIDFQRRLILSKLSSQEGVLIGRVPQKQYNKEIQSAQFVLSPFGWGELCFRDFEAFLNRATLIKPSVAHLETWPDVFVEGETYIPLDWDMADLPERMRYHLARKEEARKIAESSHRRYCSLVTQANLDRRIEELLSDLSA